MQAKAVLTSVPPLTRLHPLSRLLTPRAPNDDDEAGITTTFIYLSSSVNPFSLDEGGNASRTILCPQVSH